MRKRGEVMRARVGDRLRARGLIASLEAPFLKQLTAHELDDLDALVDGDAFDARWHQAVMPKLFTKTMNDCTCAACKAERDG